MSVIRSRVTRPTIDSEHIDPLLSVPFQPLTKEFFTYINSTPPKRTTLEEKEYQTHARQISETQNKSSKTLESSPQPSSLEKSEQSIIRSEKQLYLSPFIEAAHAIVGYLLWPSSIINTVFLFIGLQ